MRCDDKNQVCWEEKKSSRVQGGFSKKVLNPPKQAGSALY